VFLEFNMHQQISYTRETISVFHSLKFGRDEKKKLQAMRRLDHRLGPYCESEICYMRGTVYRSGICHPNSQRSGEGPYVRTMPGARLRSMDSPQSLFAAET
jgi:hypothetical protein